MKFNGFEFTSKDDHSKWAVAASKESDWICVGDINRAVSQQQQYIFTGKCFLIILFVCDLIFLKEHQEDRGGGTTCQRSSTIANAYRSAIESFDPCSNELKKKRIVKKRATATRKTYTRRRYSY